MEKSKDVKIYSLCYTKKDFEFLDDKVVTPLQVGADCNNEDVCELKDNTGDNISSKNFFYIENTGTYWIWKNVHDCKYKGQMQYRRQLKGINEKTDFDRIFHKYDVITCTPYDYRNVVGKDGMRIPGVTVEQGYGYSNCIIDLKILENIIKSDFPEYAENYDKIIKEGSILYYSSGYIMRAEDYDRYCEFLFKLLDKFVSVMRITDIKSLYYHVGVCAGMGGYKPRYENAFLIPEEAIRWQSEIGGFLGERIWTLWVLTNFDRDRIYTTPYIKMEKSMLL